MINQKEIGQESKKYIQDPTEEGIEDILYVEGQIDLSKYILKNIKEEIEKNRKAMEECLQTKDREGVREIRDKIIFLIEMKELQEWKIEKSKKQLEKLKERDRLLTQTIGKDTGKTREEGLSTVKIKAFRDKETQNKLKIKEEIENKKREKDKLVEQEKKIAKTKQKFTYKEIKKIQENLKKIDTDISVLRNKEGKSAKAIKEREEELLMTRNGEVIRKTKVEGLRKRRGWEFRQL